MAPSAIFPRDRVTIVGVVNVTPDSFSDGGRFFAGPEVCVEGVVSEARAQVAAGAHVVDVGGESTRPGAEPVPREEEIARTRPVVEALAKDLAVPVSIDTRHAEVADAALEAGARIVNDVSGLADPAMASVAARHQATLIVGHLRGVPETMQDDVRFGDAVADVGDELAASLDRARAAGVPDDALVADPGIGFGKRLEHNAALLAGSGQLRVRLGVPILVGPSRKSFLGALTGDPVAERDLATHAACAIAAFAGADAVRVHDVEGARRAMAVALALREAGQGLA